MVSQYDGRQHENRMDSPSAVPSEIWVILFPFVGLMTSMVLPVSRRRDVQRTNHQ